VVATIHGVGRKINVFTNIERKYLVFFPCREEGKVLEHIIPLKIEGKKVKPTTF
jgi:hypothetical protein